MSSTNKQETKFIVRYDPHVAPETGSSQSYKLLEISPELARVIEAAEKDGKEGVTYVAWAFPAFLSLTLALARAPGDDAVICTSSQTFSLRTITISNSMLFLRPTPTTSSTTVLDSPEPQQQQQNLLIQDTAHEILELTPTVPRLDRLETLLKHTSWTGMRGFGDGAGGLRGVKRSFVDERVDMDGTHSALLQSLVQASDVELDAGLKDRNVIQVDATSSDDRYADPSAIAVDLETDFSVDPQVSRGVMGVFGDLVVVLDDDAAAAAAAAGGREVWRARLPRLVKEIGRGLLSLESTLDPPTVDDFMARWKEQVGPEYEMLLTLDSLEGEYLLKQPPPSSSSALLRSSPLVVPFSVSTLPLDPAQRFSDLFATRAQWRPEDMQPFLRGLTPEGDRKALDKLVVKYVRVVKDSGKGGKGSSVWWHARR
ncbi:hypothetical protein QFC22_006020 [Naganishia vaughanmartiniae]|uniref:Uncharacterized protein n=1 Tax=Naganishia vaughanmartiniae TaxID=1424756 RepID=A0ACC2WNZ2_9TREE|nr:hypothetical protein QFC22_006020 [Naganishia vaughanmartiniae]